MLDTIKHVVVVVVVVVVIHLWMVIAERAHAREK